MVDREREGVQGGLTDEEKRGNVLRLAFGGDEDRFGQFCRLIREEIPEGTAVVLRGSALTGLRWKDGAPFDADGPGTGALGLTLVGEETVGSLATVLSAGYVDSFRQLHPADLGYTLPTPDPHVRLDYAFVPAAFAQHVRRCEIVKTPDVAAASDRFPLLLEVDAT